MAISSAQDRWLARLARTQRWTVCAGTLLALAGCAYAIWGVARFDPRVDPRSAPGFDRPVARLAFLYEAYQAPIERIRAETATEQVLLDTLASGMCFGAGVVLMLLRLFLGTLAAFAGLTMLTVVVERRRLLAILDAQRSAPGPELAP